jgi:DtxR family Mn-dependent transcriptional regulator
MEQRLDEFLGFPTLDPHGDVIPSADGTVAGGETVPLSTVGPSSVVIRRVSDEETEILQHASRLGIALNKEIRVREKIRFDDSLRVEIDGKEQFVSGKMAENVFVEVIPEKRGKRDGRPA